MKRCLVLACGIVACLAPPAFAVDWYAGVAGGATIPGHLGDSLLASRQPTDNTSLFGTIVSPKTSGDDARAAWKLLVGRRITRYLAVEASYTDFGKEKFGWSGFPYMGLGPGQTGAVLDTETAERRVTAWGLDLVGHWPLGERFDLLAGIGIANAKVSFRSEYRSTVRILSPPPPDEVTTSDASRTATRARWMLGADWRMTPAWALRATYERIEPFGDPLTFRLPGNIRGGTGEAAQEAGLLTLVHAF